MSKENGMREWDNGKMHFEMFPEEVLQLNEEITNHPALQEILTGVDGLELEQRIVACGKYVGIEMNGMYSSQGMIHMCGLILKELIKKRTIVIARG